MCAHTKMVIQKTFFHGIVGEIVLFANMSTTAFRVAKAKNARSADFTKGLVKGNEKQRRVKKCKRCRGVISFDCNAERRQMMKGKNRA